ncbi:trihelix transcription factor GT-2-like [Solanum pennellii]|uniref:Trihelix transcription factor GT-2-like n=1 Tax=Solanum pennellii TaxID=28526 RepID=A0ABM1FT70_SOLPN|nr:trihelix transcription factor GT-2-like [Solanum pennellii]
MLGVSSSLIASSTITAGAAGDGAAISAAPSQLAPPPQEAPESGGSSEGGGGGGDLSIGGEDGERNSGGNRWPRQETLALLKIRSEMDVVFKDSSLKGPLWEEVSRKLAELGYHRSAKKCKEKFENVYKYHRRTKDGRASKADGKTYRFFDQLQALENNPSSHSNIPPPPLAATPITMAMPMRSGNNSANPPTPTPQNHNHFFSVSQKSVVTGAAQPAVMTAPALPLSQVALQPIGNNLNQMNTTTKTSFLSNSTSSSSSTSSDEDIQRRQMKKRKWKEFFESLMKDVIEKQEELQKKFLETLEKRERDRLMREETWRVQEMARLNREHDLLVQERSMAAAKDATIIAFLQKITEQQNTQTPNSTNNTSPFPIAQMQLKLSEKPFSTQSQPQSQPQPSAIAVSLPMTIHTPTPAPPPQTLTLPVVSSKSLEPPKSDNGGENFSPASSSRWPKEEIEALISLRTCLDLKYQENGPKGPLWEEISSGMRKIGYNRNAKRCKEKWENINKYFKKVKESNKRRPEDSKTCPYFHQLEALYKEKAKLEAVTHNTAFGLTPENTPPPPIMAQPEQQWPIPQNQLHQQQQQQNRDHHHDNESDSMDHDLEEDEDEEDEGNGYEIITNKQQSSSMAATTVTTTTTSAAAV